MSNLHLFIGLMLFCLIFPATAPADPIELFNGKDFTGWTPVSSDPNTKLQDVWSVQDGNIHCVGSPHGYIRTNDDYTSFDLKFQWRTLKAGNSGCLIRCQAPDKVWPKSIECQLLTNNAGDIWVVDGFPIHIDDPSRQVGRQIVKFHPSNEKKLGEWNDYEIIADGPNLTIKINGEIQNAAHDMQVIPGKILMQAEGAEIEFRHLELTKLPDAGTGAPPTPEPQQEGPTRLFDGKDLAGWKAYFKQGGKASDAFSVEKGGVLHYAGGKEGFLMTDRPYTNYILRAQWRFPEKAGDNGILLRLQPQNKIWPKCLEAQMLSDNAGDIWLLDGEKAVGDPDRTKAERIMKMQPSSEKPLGQWNQYELTAQGGKLQLRVNYVLQNEVKNWDTKPGLIALQAQDVPVDFKDIELWPLPDPAHPPVYPTLPGLEGWHVTGHGTWTYKDGVIEGKQSKDIKTYTHLVTDASYHNFVATLKYRCDDGNSGFYFRSLVDSTGNVHGFQAEIDVVRDAGGLYESWGRGWVSQPSKADVAAHYKVKQWNEMKVEAKGPHVTVWVNDWKAAEINDPNVVMDGPCALQIHGGQDVDVMFKDIHIKRLPD